MNIISLRKTGILILTVILLISFSIPAFADVGTVVLSYPNGINSAVDNQAQAQQLLRAEWETWKNNYVSTSGRKRILGENGNYTTSQGMGYGMLLSVYFNEKTLFDGFFDYVKYCYDSKGLMHWKTEDGRIVEQNSDSSADQNIALALIFAHKMWGSDGQIDYETEANTLLNKIKQYECSSTGDLFPGDSFSDPRNPGYLAPGWYEIFRDFSESDFWYSAKSRAYSLAKMSAHSTTGLVPNWCSPNGGPSGPYYSYDFGYDAVQFILKTAIAYSWYGHADAKALCSKPTNFFNNIGAVNIVDGYNLNGTPIGGFHSAAFVACAAAGTMTGTDRQLAKTFYDECLATEANDYYGSTLRLLTLMYMTGNLQNLYQNGNQLISTSSTSPTTTTSAATTPSVGSGKTVLTISRMPIAAILQEMGGTVEWNDAEQKATIRWNGMIVELWNGKKVISVNGIKKEMDVAPNIIKKGSTMLSPRLAAETPGCIFSWEGGSTQTKTIVNGLAVGDAVQNIQKPAATKSDQNTLNQKNISAGKWDGVWFTDLGPMELLQSGNTVIGTYGEDKKVIDGTVSENKLVCKYNNGGAQGIAEFTMSLDGLSFTGIHGNNGTLKSAWSKWDGKR
jgi:endo-1,4-beta-D-glucanase Y